MIHSMSELTRRVIRQTLKELRVSMPARVVQYNAARQMAQVEIVQPELDDDGEIIMQPVIAEVPVSWPRAGGAHLTFPVSRGDTGIVVFADRDIGGWVADGDTSAPESERRHSISDAVFIPGVQGGGVSADPSNVELALDDARYVINPGNTIAMGNSSEELLQLIDEFLEATANGICATGSFLSTRGDIEAIRARLQSIKGSL